MNNTKRKTLIYTIGVITYFFAQWLLSVLIVRLSGYEAAGMLSLALTVCAAPSIIGLFNVRSYQVSDVEGVYGTKTYVDSRHVTNTIAVISCIVMIIGGGYSQGKVLVILAFMSYKVVENIADVYYGIEQLHQKLNIAGISSGIRGILSLFAFVVGLRLTKQLYVSLLLMTFLSMLVLLVYDRKVISEYFSEDNSRFSERKPKIRLLLTTCIPLAIASFLNNYSINFPKILLEKEFGSEVMGYFSTVTSPCLVIQIIATSIFAPLITPLSKAFVEKNSSFFYRTLSNFFRLAFLLSVFCIFGCIVLGKMFLTLIYGKGVQPYSYIFVYGISVMILIAINAILFSICTLVREIKLQYFVGAIGLLSSIVFSHFFVKYYSMMGVIYAQAASILIQVIIQIIIIRRKLKKVFFQD